ncbi:MAG: glycine cleavage T C-terminal barrel domain-containing protein [Candidatus Puniceispirillaceae bacterium]
MKSHGLNPRIRKSPFFEATIASGATEFHPYNGMWMPVGYDTPVNEYWNVIERAGLWDVAVQRVVEFSGPDALAFMELLTPRNVAKVAVGQCRYIFLCNQDGGLLNDPVMLRIAEDRFWICCADADMYMWAKGVAVHAGMNVDIGTPAVYPMQIQGPASVKIISRLFGDSVLDLGYYRWMQVQLDGRDFILSRTGFSSEVGFELFMLGAEGGTEIWNHILSEGAEFGLTPGSPNRIRRIEGGVLDYGSDMTIDENPFEVGLGKRIDFDKGDFIGRDALLALSKTPPARTMCGVFVDGPAFKKNNEHRWPVYCGDRQVGEMTSAVHSPRLERNIGFVLMQTDFAKSENSFTVQTAEGLRPLTLTDMPFIDPDKKIPRAALR